jgi:hypothetical protein
VPPHSVLAPGTALRLLRSRALSSAQAIGIVRAGPCWRMGQNREEMEGTEGRSGCSIRVASWQLEIPPVWAYSRCDLDAAAWASNGPGQQHDALGGVALTVRNSHQIRPHRPGSVAWPSCPRSSWAVPCEGMCWEQSRRTRTIATSRSDDNRIESRKTDRGKNAGLTAANELEDHRTYAQRYRYGATQKKTVSA